MMSDLLVLGVAVLILVASEVALWRWGKGDTQRRTTVITVGVAIPAVLLAAFNRPLERVWDHALDQKADASAANPPREVSNRGTVMPTTHTSSAATPHVDVEPSISAPSAAPGNRVWSTGKWSKTEDNFTLTVREIGVSEGRIYALIEAKNRRDEGVSAIGMHLKDPSGKRHSKTDGPEGNRWPDPVPPNDTVSGFVYFEGVLEEGSGKMRLDVNNVFVKTYPSEVPNLSNGLYVADIPVTTR